MVEETIFYTRLKEQIKIRKTSFNQVERDLGYPRNSLNNYKNGNEPSGKRLVELSEYFMVSPGFLIGKEKKGQEQEQEQFFRTFFQKLDFEQKRELYVICEKWSMSQLFRNNKKLDREMLNESL